MLDEEEDDSPVIDPSLHLKPYRSRLCVPAGALDAVRTHIYLSPHLSLRQQSAAHGDARLLSLERPFYTGFTVLYWDARGRG